MTEYKIAYEYESQYKMFNWEAKYIRDMTKDDWELVTIVPGDMYAQGVAYPQRQYQWVWRRPKIVMSLNRANVDWV